MDIQKIKELDKENVYGSIQYLPDQIEQVLNDFETFTFPDAYKNASSIVISGMGGSIYNYYVISSLFSDSLKVPVTMLNGYNIPAYVQKNTLFIGSSYSGSTEETINSTKEAIGKALVTSVTAGGKLGELINENHLPYYQFEPKFNPCGQPRVGLGYTIFGPIMLLHKLGLLNIDLNQVKNALKKLKNEDKEIQENAHELATQFDNKVTILVASEHLSSNVHILRNQINETAKAFAEYHLLPELNHHLLEGLTYPKEKNLLFAIFNSKFYFDRNNKRYPITKDVLKKQNIEFIDLEVQAENKIEEFLKYLQLGSYISFFMGIQNNLNPSLIPWVDYFKKELNK